MSTCISPLVVTMMLIAVAVVTAMLAGKEEAIVAWRSFYLERSEVVVEWRVVLASFGQTSCVYPLVGSPGAQKCTMGGAQPLGIREPCSG